MTSVQAGSRRNRADQDHPTEGKGDRSNTSGHDRPPPHMLHKAYSLNGRDTRSQLRQGYHVTTIHNEGSTYSGCVALAVLITSTIECACMRSSGPASRAHASTCVISRGMTSASSKSWWRWRKYSLFIYNRVIGQGKTQCIRSTPPLPYILGGIYYP